MEGQGMMKENEEGWDGGVEVSSRMGRKKREREGKRTRWKDRG